MDYVGSVPMGSDVNPIIRKLETCAKASIDWAERCQLEFDNAKTAEALCTGRCGTKTVMSQKHRAKIRVWNSFVRLNKETTRWLGDWIDSQLTHNEHHN
jgi:hypothetical protein